MSPRTYALAADAVLLLHACFVAFVVGGWASIWLGRWRRWAWVRGRGFRIAHLAAIGIVAGQAALGRICPLTLLEDALRGWAGQGAVYERTFIEHWVGRCLFFEGPPWMFMALYLVVFALVLGTWWWVPVRPRSRRVPLTPDPPQLGSPPL